jgi:hypothetical protein
MYAYLEEDFRTCLNCFGKNPSRFIGDVESVMEHVDVLPSVASNIDSTAACIAYWKNSSTTEWSGVKTELNVQEDTTPFSMLEAASSSYNVRIFLIHPSPNMHPTCFGDYSLLRTGAIWLMYDDVSRIHVYVPRAIESLSRKDRSRVELSKNNHQVGSVTRETPGKTGTVVPSLVWPEPL